MKKYGAPTKIAKVYGTDEAKVGKEKSTQETAEQKPPQEKKQTPSKE